MHEFGDLLLMQKKEVHIGNFQFKPHLYTNTYQNELKKNFNVLVNPLETIKFLTNCGSDFFFMHND